MTEGVPAPSRLRWAPVLGIAGLTVLAHLLFNLTTGYQLHRDAFLYLAMGENLSLFGMDFPPMIAIVAEASRFLLGDSLAAIRTVPMLAHGALVFLAALSAALVGGRGTAQSLAALTVATAPVYLRAGTLFQPVVLDQLWWTGALFLLAMVAAARRSGDEWATRPWWLALGAVLGLALLTKFTALVLGAGILLGILATPLRKELTAPWPWAAAGIALLVGSPGIIGQIRLGFPVFGQVAVLSESQLARVSPVSYVMEQLLLVGPIVLAAAAGAVLLVSRRSLRTYAVMGWTTIACFFLMMAAGGKAYYIAPIWPALLGVGLVQIQDLGDRVRGRWPQPAGHLPMTAAALVIVLFGAVGLPMGMPVLGPAAMARYAQRLGVTQAVTTNTGTVIPLPQDYADMLGWEELVGEVAEVYHGLDEEDRERTVILATNYGEAGAIDFYGPRLGLPGAVCPVGSYWYFGPGERSGEVTVVVGEESEVVETYFGDVRLARRVANPWGVPEEQDVPILIAKAPLGSLQDLWEDFAGQH